MASQLKEAAAVLLSPQEENARPASAVIMQAPIPIVFLRVVTLAIIAAVPAQAPLSACSAKHIQAAQPQASALILLLTEYTTLLQPVPDQI